MVPHVVGGCGVGVAGEMPQMPAQEIILTKLLSTVAGSGYFLALL